jgi:hypothetical membrane protein
MRSQIPIRILALCGVIATLVFTTLTLVFGALYPGYDHASQQISELGARGAPNALGMNVLGFGLTGLLTIGFAYSLQQAFSPFASRQWGPALIGIGGLSLLAVSVFSCDAGCELGSARAARHSITAGLTISSMILAQFLFASTFRSTSEWRRFAGYSRLSALTSIGLAFAFGLAYFGEFDQWIGISERVLVGIGLLWMSVVGIQLFRLTKPQPSSQSPESQT